jgi:hypothetical protein
MYIHLPSVASIVYIQEFINMGRKPLAEKRQDNLLLVRMTRAERDELNNAARQEGKPTSTWARDYLLKLARRIARKK